MGTEEPGRGPEHEWHRTVAMQCNNRAWALSVQSRTPAEDLEMLTAAHTSAYHWGQIGTELQRMRATMLVAEVQALMGSGAMAFRLASEMRDYFANRPDTPDWEHAFVHTIHAHAACAAGRLDEHRASYQQALLAIEGIADPEDRAIVMQTFTQVPTP